VNGFNVVYQLFIAKTSLIAYLNYSFNNQSNFRKQQVPDEMFI